MNWISSALGYGPDPEIEAAKRRNALRDLGEEIKKERTTLEEKRTKEVELYRFALEMCKGDLQSPFGKQAIELRKNVLGLGREIEALNARLRPIETMLATACQRQRDARMSELMQGVISDEKRTANPELRRNLGRAIASAKTLTSETRGIQDDLDSSPLDEPDDESAIMASIASDYSALVAASASASSRGSTTEADADAAAAIARKRSFPTWSPPASFAAMGGE